MNYSDRETMEYDVVVVGAGPAGLTAACRIKQLNPETGVCIVEKGSEVGAHILSGAVFETSALNELFPDWKERGAPLHTPVSKDEAYLLRNAESALKIPNIFVPKTMHNQGNYIISLGNFCRWLAEQAETLGVEIFPGFTASDLAIGDDGAVKGVITGDMGVSADGSEKDGHMPGMALLARCTLLAEGCRGHLGKSVIARYRLDEGRQPQHYGLGIKELWKVDPKKHSPGLVMHTAGWPLAESRSAGGGFLYHMEENQVVVGLITDLSYSNPHLSPYEEFQRYKHHPVIKQYLEGGERLAYGARAIVKGGLQALPQMSFPGGLLLGDDAGTLNFAKIKGSHTAMKSGLLAAEVAHKTLKDSKPNATFDDIGAVFRNSSLFRELHLQRNFGPAQHRWGNLLGSAYAFLDINLCNGKLPWTLSDKIPDFATLKPAASCSKIEYPRPDGKLSFDKLSSVYLSNTNHEEDQPCHLHLKDAALPIEKNLPLYDEPAQRYCPAGVYEIVTEDGAPRFQINAQNCVHCKTCDIKDPLQNINWVAPEGGGGPNYPNM